METLEKKGKGSALLPFLLFIVIYLGAGLYFQAQGVEMAFYQFPSVTAMFIALLLLTFIPDISLAIPKLLGGYVSPIANPLGPVFIH